MASQTEAAAAGEFLYSEDDGGTYSRENIQIKSGAGVLPAGRMLGALTVTSTSAVKASGANTGNGTMGAITTTPNTAPGLYTVRITVAALNAGTFELRNPQGELRSTGTVGVAFNNGFLAFTLADGTTDFIVGDGFDITVPPTLYTNYDDSLADGTQQARGILWAETDATSSQQLAEMVCRAVEVVSARVTSLTAGHKAAGIVDLAALGVIFR